MKLGIVLAILGVLLFIGSILFISNKRSTYLLFLAYFLPFVDLWLTPSSYGNLSVFDGITIIAGILFFRDITTLNRGNRFYVITAVIFIVLIVLGSIASQFKLWSLLHLPPIITPFIYGAILLRELKENDDFLHQLIKAIKVSAWVGIFFMVMQLAVGISFTHYEGLNPNVIDGDGFRYPGFFMDTQGNGAFMAFASILFLINFYDPANPKFSNYWQFAVMALGVVLAGSRSPMMGLGVALVFLTIFIGGNFRSVFISVLAGIAILALVFQDYIPIFNRFTQLNDSLSFRAAIWADAWKIYYQEYLLGIGTENYQQYIMIHSQDQFLLLDNDEISYLMQPENGYLKWLVEFGFFGTALLFSLILAPIIKVMGNFFNGKKIVTQFFFIAPIIVWLISFSSLYNLYDKRLAMLLVTFCVILICYPKDFIFEHEEQ